MRMMLLPMAITAAVSLLLSGCADPAETPTPEKRAVNLGPIRNDAAKGYIDGTLFVFASGRAIPSTEKPDTLNVEMWEAYIADPCLNAAPVSRSISFSVPKTAQGSLQLSDEMTLTFVRKADDPSSTLIVKEGELKIEAFTDLELQGGVIARNKADHINGSFKVQICSSN